MALPLYKINSLGLPYHGLVSNHQLTLSNNQEISYPGLSTGDTQLVAIPNHTLLNCSLEQQAFDIAKSLEWRNYAIVSDNHLGAANLGYDWLLYIDPNRVVWFLKLGYEIVGSSCVMSCSLHKVFGRFNTDYPIIDRVLVRDDTTFNHAGKLKPLNRFTFERKPDGSEVLIHAYVKFEKQNTIHYPYEMSLYEIWKLKLTGAGDLKTHALGQGIEATLVRYKSFNEINTIKNEIIARTEDRCRVAKINIKYFYDPEPAEPPECKSNYRRSKFELKLVPETEAFIPFEIDKNTYVQTNWFGHRDVTTSIIRMVYDSEGMEHTFKAQKEYKELRNRHHAYDGYGSAVQGPIQYFFNGFMCVVNGYWAGWDEQYSSVSKSTDGLEITHCARIMVNDITSYLIELKGLVMQVVTERNNEPSDKSIEISVTLNNEILRHYNDTYSPTDSGSLKDPFSNKLKGDNAFGIFANFNLGLLSNNLICLVERRIQASNIDVLKKEQVNAIVAHNKTHISNKSDGAHFDASYEPMTSQIALSHGSVFCWV